MISVGPVRTFKLERSICGWGHPRRSAKKSCTRDHGCLNSRASCESQSSSNYGCDTRRILLPHRRLWAFGQVRAQVKLLWPRSPPADQRPQSCDLCGLPMSCDTAPAQMPQASAETYFMRLHMDMCTNTSLCRRSFFSWCWGEPLSPNWSMLWKRFCMMVFSAFS